MPVLPPLPREKGDTDFTPAVAAGEQLHELPVLPIEASAKGVDETDMIRSGSILNGHFGPEQAHASKGHIGQEKTNRFTQFPFSQLAKMTGYFSHKPWGYEIRRSVG